MHLPFCAGDVEYPAPEQLTAICEARFSLIGDINKTSQKNVDLICSLDNCVVSQKVLWLLHMAALVPGTHCGILGHRCILTCLHLLPPTQRVSTMVLAASQELAALLHQAFRASGPR